MARPNPNFSNFAEASYTELVANGYTVTPLPSAVGRRRKPAFRVKPTCNKAGAKRRPMQHGTETGNGPAMAG